MRSRRIRHRGGEIVREKENGMSHKREGGGGDGGIRTIRSFMRGRIWESKVADGEGQWLANNRLDRVYT